MNVDADESSKDKGRSGQRRRANREPGVLTYAVPVGIGTDVTIEGKFPMSDAEWTQLMAVVAAMKPALVGERTEDQAELAQPDEDEQSFPPVTPIEGDVP